ncbi:MAG: hypothetical protein HFE97_03700 [Oscillospiraceae bacterium]|nr:hypothetical protein [Oscillospiraceae bacterium]
MRLLCLGDSNTYGYDPRSYLGGRYPEEVRWTALLGRQTGWELLNEGENGREIPHTPTQLREMDALFACSGQIDSLVIMLGSNDLLQIPQATAEGVTERMERFLTRLLDRGQLPTVTVLIAPPAMKPGPWISGEHQLYQSTRLGECYQALARRLNLSFADAGMWNIDLAFDGLHFSPAGHQTFALCLAELLS